VGILVFTLLLKIIIPIETGEFTVDSQVTV